MSFIRVFESWDVLRADRGVARWSVKSIALSTFVVLRVRSRALVTILKP